VLERAAMARSDEVAVKLTEMTTEG
jgi:hypothetical protein